MAESIKIPAPKKSIKPLIEEYDVTLPTGRVVTMRELTMREQMIVDREMTEKDERAVLYYRTIAMVLAVDGVPLEPAKGRNDLDSAMEKLTGLEFNELFRDYMKRSGIDEVKNSQSAQESSE